MDLHGSIIGLVIAYTLVGAFIFTVIITCLSLIGLVKFSDKAQQQKLFYALIIEVVVISTAFFSGFLKFTSSKTEENSKQEEDQVRIETSQKIHDLRKDVKYLDWLTKVEYQAVKESVGIWSNSEVRTMKQDIVDEVNFQTNANILQKIWRWLRER